MSKGPAVTARMKKGIKACTTILDIKYEGSTFDDAKKFLESNLPKIEGKDIREYIKPSEKMLRGIEFITQTIGVVYEGDTMKEASEFISKYMDKALEKQKGKKR